MIKMICDHCGKDNETIDKKSFGGADIARYTVTVNKQESKKFMPGMSWGGAVYTDGVSYHGPEFTNSIDLCWECYKKVKENFKEVFNKKDEIL